MVRAQAPRASHACVLSCRGVEAEASLSFAALSELLTDCFDEVASALVAPRRRALEVALLLAEPGDSAPSSAELTETEQRVAGLAAEGRSNREIAAELFMGVSTVEAHLSRVYRKLGIRSRAGLAGRLAIPVDEPAQT